MSDNEKKTLGTDQVKEKLELEFAELENVAGGREMRNSEKRNALELKSRMYLRIYDLRSEQNYAEEKRLYDGLAEAMNKWKEDIANAPLICYTLKGQSDKRVHVGSVAQYWDKILPETIDRDANGTLSMHYDVQALSSAIVLAREVVELKKEIAELKKMIYGQ